MRTFKVPGIRKKVRLPERDYKQLLERFDLTNIEGHSIKKPCICKRYHPWIYCPLAPTGRRGECIDLLENLGLTTDMLSLTFGCIEWEPEGDRQAREEIKTIYDFLLGLEKK